MSFDVQSRVATWVERLTLVRAVGTILSVAVVLVLVAGLLERLVEPEVFTSLGLSYWWAITTVTTVGYGDIVPKSPEGRVVGALLMLTGLALIPTLTSVIVSTLISKRTQEQTRHFEGELAKSIAALQRIEDRLARSDPGPPPSTESR